MKNDEIVIMYKQVGKNPKIKRIENKTSSFKEILKGKIEIIPYNDIVIICSKDRRI